MPPAGGFEVFQNLRPIRQVHKYLSFRCPKKIISEFLQLIRLFPASPDRRLDPKKIPENPVLPIMSSEHKPSTWSHHPANLPHRPPAALTPRNLHEAVKPEYNAVKCAVVQRQRDSVSEAKVDSITVEPRDLTRFADHFAGVVDALKPAVSKFPQTERDPPGATPKIKQWLMIPE